jgi:cytochrome c oxidase assembly factor CtaG
VAADRRVVLLAAGLFVALGAISPPVDEMARDNLVGHMAQHVVLLSLAAPLLAFGTS